MKEEKRLRIIQKLVDGKLDVESAARLLDITVRHVYRLKAEAKKHGIPRIVHAGRGRTPSNKIDQKVWDEVLSLVNKSYRDLDYRRLQKVLARKHNIRVGRESLRKRLRAAGIMPKKRGAVKRSAFR